MYNTDGTLRSKLQKKPAPQSGLSLSWGGDATKENCSAASNSPTNSPKAAGVRSKITSIAGEGSPLRARGKPGSDRRAAQNQGSLSFGAEESQESGRHREVSEAKKKALYASHVFGGSGDSPAPPPANELSELKLREVTGSDIFNNEAADEEPKRSVLGGVRKAPGGGSSVSLRDPATPKPSTRSSEAVRHPGGKSSFQFGW